jgi:hypothetical protein
MRREEVLEHLVGEQLVSVVREERLDAAVGNELATKRRCIEELPVGTAMSLHLTILDDRWSNREHRARLFSTVS